MYGFLVVAYSIRSTGTCFGLDKVIFFHADMFN